MKGVKEKRLKYEYEELKKFPQFKINIDPKNNFIWYVSFKGADNSLYENENFILKFHFDGQYVNIIIYYC